MLRYVVNTLLLLTGILWLVGTMVAGAGGLLLGTECQAHSEPLIEGGVAVMLTSGCCAIVLTMVHATLTVDNH